MVMVKSSRSNATNAIEKYRKEAENEALNT